MSFFRVTCDCSCQASDSTCGEYTCPSQIGVSYTFPDATVQTTEAGVTPVTCSTTLKSQSGDLNIFNNPDAWGDNCGYRGTTTENCVENPYCIPPITGDNFNVSCWNGDAVWEGATCGDQWDEPQVISNWYWERGVIGDCDCITQDATCRDDGYCVKERKAAYHRHTITVLGGDDKEYQCACRQAPSHPPDCGCPEGWWTDPPNRCAGYCSNCADFVSLYYVGAIQSKTAAALYYVDFMENDLFNGWFLFLGRSMMSGLVGRQQDCQGNWGTQIFWLPASAKDESTCCPNTQSATYDPPNPNCGGLLYVAGGYDPSYICASYWGDNNPYADLLGDVQGVLHPLYGGHSSWGTWWALPKEITDCQDLNGISINTSGVEIARRYCPFPNVYPSHPDYLPDGRVVGSATNASWLIDTDGFEATNWSISIA